MDVSAYIKAIEFAKNRRRTNPGKQGISNLYVIRRLDKSGNVLDTKFGENLITDYGFQRHFVNGTSWPTRVYVGDGIPTSGHFSQESQTLENIITETQLTNSNTTKDYACPLFYDSASSSTEQGGLITTFCQYLVCYMDYTNSTYGIADASKLIYEFGIGESSTQLWTHSRVYTSSGSPSHVVKNDNERLEFTIFLCCSYYESLIVNGWNDAGHVDGKYGTYSVITTPYRMFNFMNPSNIYTFQRNNQNNVSRTFTNSSTAIENTYITKTALMNSVMMETLPGDGKIKTGSGYIDGFVNYSPGWTTIEREELNRLETIDMIVHPSTPYLNGISDGFGVRDLYRFTQLEEITSFDLFDYTTNTWTNHSDYENDSRKWYDETPLMTTFGQPIYYMSNNTVQTLYVHQNINQLDGITAITSGNLIVYMAEKYWDTSTWVHITDLLHIPSAYKNYKYILTGDNGTELKVERELPTFHVVPRVGENVVDIDFTKIQGLGYCLDNYDYGWYKRSTAVYVPDTLKTYTTDSAHSMTWSKWLVDYPSSSNIVAYDMSNVVSQQPSSLTSYSVTPAFGTTVSNILSSCYRTDSGTGLICLFNKSASRVVVIDLNSFDGTTFTTNHLLSSSCIMACCIVNTRKVAYIQSSAKNAIVIYDYDTNQIETTITISELSGVTPSILIGMNGIVWISDGSSSTTDNTYCVNISTGTYSVCNASLTPWSTSASFGNFKMSFTNNFLVIYNYSNTMYSHPYAIALRADIPTEIKSLKNLTAGSSSYWSGFNITLRNVVTDTSSNTCAMIISSQYTGSTTGCFNAVIDLGYYWYAENNTFNIDNYYNDHGNSVASNTNGTMIPYGQFLMVNNNKKTPLEYAMPHKLIGKTRTITTQNTYKNISNKSWSVTFTNTPRYHGLPPGTMMSL